MDVRQLLVWHNEEANLNGMSSMYLNENLTLTLDIMKLSCANAKSSHTPNGHKPNHHVPNGLHQMSEKKTLHAMHVPLTHTHAHSINGMP